MLYVLIISAAIFIATAALTFWESVSHVRVGGRTRLRIDRMVARVGRTTGRAGLYTRRFLLRDVIANMLHMCTYTALVIVRAVERMLARGANALRRRAHKHK